MMPNINVEMIGTRIKAARLEHGLTQYDLAKMSGAQSQMIIHQYENGLRFKRPEIEFLVNIAKVLNLSVDWLLMGEKH